MKWIPAINFSGQKQARWFTAETEKLSKNKVKKMLEENGLPEISPDYSAGTLGIAKEITAENLDLIGSMAKSYLDRLERELTRQLPSGAGDIHSIYKKIAKSNGVKLDRHAAIVARDQSAKAISVLTRLRTVEAGINEAVWVHSSGGKEPRPGHKAFSGEKFDLRLGALLDNAGAKAKKPDIRYTWPGHEINCRCVYRPYLEELE